MAQTPLYNGGRTPQAAPLPPLYIGQPGRSARTTIAGQGLTSFNPVVDDSAQLAQAGRTMGEAIRGIGGEAFDIALAEQKARNYAANAEAELELLKARSDHMTWRLKHPDPDTWKEHFDSSMDAAEQRIKGKAYAPDVADSLGLTMKQKREAWTTETQYEVSQAHVRRAVVAADAKREMGVMNGDYNMVSDATREHAELTGLPDEARQVNETKAFQEISRKNLDAWEDRMKAAAIQGDAEEVKRISTEFEAFPGLAEEEKESARRYITQFQTEAAMRREASAFPDKVLKDLNDPEKVKDLSPVQVQDLRNDARRLIRNNSSDAFQVAREDINAGMMSDPSALDGKDFSMLIPSHRALLKDVMAVKRQEASLNDPANYHAAVAMIADYDVEADAQNAGFNETVLRDRIGALHNGPQQKKLTELLDAKIKGIEGLSADTAKASQERGLMDVETTLSKLFNEKKFGEWESQAKDANGKPMFSKVKRYDDEGDEIGDQLKPTMVKDEAKKAAAQATQEKIKKEIVDAIKLGNITDPQKINEIRDSIIARHLGKQGAASLIQQAPAPAYDGLLPPMSRTGELLLKGRGL